MLAAIFGASLLAISLIGVFTALLFLVPSIIAVKRNHPNKIPIILVNLLLGCSGLGWIIALIWSMTNTESNA